MIFKIFKDNEQINIIESSEDFVKSYCEKQGYTYEEDVRPEPEPEPTPEPTPALTIEERLTSVEEETTINADALDEMANLYTDIVQSIDDLANMLMTE